MPRAGRSSEAQDNGTLCFAADQGPQRWTTIFGGDGGWCAADPTDPDVFYGEYVRLSIHRNTDGGTTDDQQGDRYISGQFWNHDEGEWDWKPAPFRIPDAKPVPDQPPMALFIAPFILDPNDPNRLLAGGMSVWRTNDAKTPNTTTTGPRWASIKAPIGPADTKVLISALAVAVGDSDTVWVGHANGQVLRTADGTAGQPLAAGHVRGVPPPLLHGHHHRPRRQPARLRVLRRVRPGNLWATRDGGATWTDLSATLPTAPVRALAVHPRRNDLVYAGTEVGLFASEDAGATWSPTNKAPPTARSMTCSGWTNPSSRSPTAGACSASICRPCGARGRPLLQADIRHERHGRGPAQGGQNRAMTAAQAAQGVSTSVASGCSSPSRASGTSGPSRRRSSGTRR